MKFHKQFHRLASLGRAVDAAIAGSRIRGSILSRKMWVNFPDVMDDLSLIANP
jgi:hypothetical protein